MNKVTLIGNLCNDPELKLLPGNGTAVATFNLAVQRKFKKEGQPTADFVPIVVWGKQAENTANYMTKGKQIAISGRLQTRNYENKDGNRVYVTEIVAEEVQFLGGKKNDDEIDITNEFFNKVTPVDDDEIPF